MVDQIYRNSQVNTQKLTTNVILHMLLNIVGYFPVVYHF